VPAILLAVCGRPLVLTPLLALCLQTNAAQPAKAVARSATSPPCCVVSAAAQPTVPDTRVTPMQPIAVEVTNLPPPAATPHPRTDWAEVIAAGATVLLALVTWMLWLATRALVRGADETAKRELRAYVFVNNPWIEHVERNQQPVAHVPFKNYGRTPAYKIRATLNIDIGADFAEVPEPNPLPDSAAGHLGPGADLQTLCALHRPLTATDPASLDAGHLTLFAYGEIHYVDAFKQAHWTKFRIMIGGSAGLRARLEDGKRALLSCPDGNETDDEI
jgi:hypothetical protein